MMASRVLSKYVEMDSVSVMCHEFRALMLLPRCLAQQCHSVAVAAGPVGTLDLLLFSIADRPASVCVLFVAGQHSVRMRIQRGLQGQWIARILGWTSAFCI